MSQIFASNDLEEILSKTTSNNIEDNKSSIRRRRKTNRSTPTSESSETETENCGNVVAAKNSALELSVKSLDSCDGLINQVMKRSQWKINLTVDDHKISDFNGICSICLSDSPTDNESGESLSSPLITPCLCSGYRSHQHKKCIEKWIEHTGATSCPFCLVRYEFTRKRKNFFSYVRDCDLEQDFLISFATTAFFVYLFLLGLSICWYQGLSEGYISGYVDGSEKNDLVIIKDTLYELRRSTELSPEVSLALDQQIKSLDKRAQSCDSTWSWSWSWSKLILFCSVCIPTVILFVGSVSISLSFIFRHYVKYWLWSNSHFKVDVKEYRLAGATSDIIADGFPS